jgi:hypothetical protein
MHNRKFKWFSGVVVVLYLFSLLFFFKPPYSNAKSIFQDVPDGHWALYDIEYMYNHGLMKGRDKQVWNFYPDKPMARAELVALELKVQHVDLTKLPAPTTAKYADVPPTYWAAGVLDEAFKRHLIPFKDVTGNTFHPDQSVTRGELAEGVILALKIPPDNTPAPNDPTDIKGTPYEGAIRALIENKFAKGKSDNTFAPDQVANRAEVASLFAKSLQAVGYADQTVGGQQ